MLKTIKQFAKKFSLKRKKRMIPNSNIIKSIREYNALTLKLKNQQK